MENNWWYGQLEASWREHVWNMLSNLHCLDYMACLYFADFNEILVQNEKLEGRA